MPLPTGAQSLSPQFRVKINGQRLPQAIAPDVMSIEVSEDLDALNMFTLTLNIWDLANGQLQWIDDDRFALGMPIEIRLGYHQQIPEIPLIVGEIVGIEPEFRADASPKMVVRGYDFRHRLMRSTETRVFTKMSDLSMLKQIAQDAGLKGGKKDFLIQHDHVFQRNQSNFDFLQGRATRYGHRLGILKDKMGKTIDFVPVVSPKPRVDLTLERQDLIEFSPRLSAMGLLGEVEVRQRDHSGAQGIIISYSTVSAYGKAKGVANAYGSGKVQILDQRVIDTNEAEKVAAGQANLSAMSTFTGEGICEGNPQLQVGKTLKLEGLGAQFSGNYLVTATTHRYTRWSGYQTEFTVRRSAP